MSEPTAPGWKRTIAMFALVTSAEAAFLLPFVLPRIFRPTMLEVFDIDNTQLGLAFSAYGWVAMASYFLGGPIADRFAPRRLMTAALALTAVGGFGLLLTPSPALLTFLYAYWGMTSILLFWAAMIRATREWGDGQQGGRAFGLLDGGRGLLAASLSSLSVWGFSVAIGGDADTATLDQRAEALWAVIAGYTGLVFAAALLIWILIPDKQPKPAANSDDTPGSVVEIKGWEGIKRVVKLPQVWLQGLIVLCAYVAYKGSDDFSLLASEGWGMNDVEAANVGTLSFWIRPVAALSAGLLADRVKGTTVLLWSFVGLAAADAVVFAGWLPTSTTISLFAAVAATSAFTYALRGVYFAIFDEGKVPLAVTGTAVGLVSFLGYTPDIFFGPLMGVLLDNNPGMTGHRHLFGVLAGFAMLGAVVTLAFAWVARRAPAVEEARA